MSAMLFPGLRFFAANRLSSRIIISNIISSNSIISNSFKSGLSGGSWMLVARRSHSKLAAPDLDLLVCPLSRLPLRLDSARSLLVNDTLGVCFPLVDGIPQLTAEDARKFTGDLQESGGDATETHGTPSP